MGVAQQRMTVYAALCPHVNVFSADDRLGVIASLFDMASTHLHLIPQNDVMCPASHWQVGREKVSCWRSRQLHLKYWAETTFLDTKFVLCLDDSFTLRHSLPKMPQNQSNLWITKLYIGCFVTPIIQNEQTSQ